MSDSESPPDDDTDAEFETDHAASPDAAAADGTVLTFELDEARALMYGRARAVNPAKVDAYLDQQLKQAVETLYDNREQLATPPERPDTR